MAAAATAAPAPSLGGSASAAAGSDSAVTTDSKSGTTTVTLQVGKLPSSFESVADVMRVYRTELDQMRAKLTPKYKAEADSLDDLHLYRFLRGYKFDLEKATSVLNTSIEWRVKNNIRAAGEKAVKMTQFEYPFADKLHRCCSLIHNHGRDRLGQPLAIECMGKCRPDLLTKLMSIEDMRQYHIFNMENKYAQLQRESKATGKIIRFAKIIDLEGLSARHIDREAFKYLQLIMAVGTANYPEGMGHLYLVRVPWIFHTIWKLVKGWVPEASLAKITICGDNWAEVLKENIDPKYLPKFLGGTCTECKDGKCIPEVDADAGFAETKVKAGAKFVHSVEIKQPNSVLSYEWRTRAYDIGFKVTVVHTGADASDKPVREYKKIENSSQLQSASIEARVCGTYTFEWDNSYSWMTAKDLLWRVDVAAPAQLETNAAATAAATATTTTAAAAVQPTGDAAATPAAAPAVQASAAGTASA